VLSGTPAITSRLANVCRRSCQGSRRCRRARGLAERRPRSCARAAWRAIHTAPPRIPTASRPCGHLAEDPASCLGHRHNGGVPTVVDAAVSTPGGNAHRAPEADVDEPRIGRLVAARRNAEAVTHLRIAEERSAADHLLA